MDLLSKLPSFAKRYTPCTSEQFKLAMEMALIDPVVMLRKRVIVFQMDHEGNTMDFWFTEISSLMINVDPYEKDSPDILYLHAEVGQHEQTAKVVTVESRDCFADFLPECAKTPEGDRIPIPSNYYIYAFLSP